VTWKKLWLLFTVIWLVVSALNAGTILAFSPDEAAKAWRPVLIGIAVPAALYLLGMTWSWLRRNRPRQE